MSAHSFLFFAVDSFKVMFEMMSKFGLEHVLTFQTARRSFTLGHEGVTSVSDRDETKSSNKLKLSVFVFASLEEIYS